MYKPLISIIIPVYNQKPIFFKECLDSAIAQKYANLEIIISNNHSTDKDCVNLINHYAEKDERIRVVMPPEHVSMMKNFNYGFLMSKGEWVTFLCSDDKYSSNCIDDMLSALQENSENISFLFSNTATFDSETGEIINTISYPKTGVIENTVAINFFLKCMGGFISGALFKSSIYKKIGMMPDDLYFAGDSYLGIASLIHGDCYYINNTLSLVRSWSTPARDSRSTKFIADIFKIYNKLEKDSDFTTKLTTTRTIRTHKNHYVLSYIYSLLTQKDKKTTFDEDKKIIMREYNNNLILSFIFNNINNKFGEIAFKFTDKFNLLNYIK